MTVEEIRNALVQEEATIQAAQERKSALIGEFDNAVSSAQSEHDQAQAAIDEAHARLSAAESALQEAVANRNALNI